MDDFILNQRTGHCERYAAALALFLRMKGTPSRVVIGYLPNSRNWVSGWFDIRLRDTFTINAQSTVHNAHMIGSRIYVAWYTEGFVLVDFSDPAHMDLVASYDTSPYGPGSGYHGAWGVYPYAELFELLELDSYEGYLSSEIDIEKPTPEHYLELYAHTVRAWAGQPFFPSKVW